VRRITQAVEYREKRGLKSESLRLVWSESDGLPGVIVDRYGPALVYQTLTKAMDDRRELIEEALKIVLNPVAIVERNDAPVRAAEAAALVERARRAAVAGHAVELRELLYGYSNAVVTRAATGAAGATADRIKQLMANSAVFMSGLQAEDVLPDAAAKMVRWATGLEKSLDVQVEAWDKFLSEIIAEHLEKKQGNDGPYQEEDFLDVLLRLREEDTAGLELTDNHIKSIVKVIDHETTH
jgi:hypothetical protein